MALQPTPPTFCGLSGETMDSASKSWGREVEVGMNCQHILGKFYNLLMIILKTKGDLI
jgi:hypothetical protein